MTSSTAPSQPLAASPTAAVQPDVSLRDVTKRFGDVVAVDAIDLDIAPGEFLALIGPSGCGKTTTLRLIAGFEQPCVGEILIGGRPTAGVMPHRRDVNTVFQQYALFPHLTVIDNVAYGLKQRRVGAAERRARAREALELVHLTGREERRPAELSGGQQQRVALARALVLRPRVLLLDEPLGALDLKLRKAMQVELKRIHREVGTTFVIVTHDQEEAMALADRVAVLNEGRIEQLAAPRTVYDYPASEFVADFIGEMNRVVGIATGAPLRVMAPRLELPIAHVIAPVAAGLCARVGVRPEDFRVEHAADGSGNATVVDGVALGHAVQLVLRLLDGGEIVVRQPRGIAGIDVPPPAGTELTVNVDPLAPILLGPVDPVNATPEGVAP